MRRPTTLLSPWQPTTVPFDVFFQRFTNGEADPGGGDAMRRLLEPFIVSEEPRHDFVRIEFGDGGADVYLDGDGMTVNHVTGAEAWDVLVEGARQAGWVILPIGCATCITDEGQRAHLPPELDEEVALVKTGVDLQAVIGAT